MYTKLTFLDRDSVAPFWSNTEETLVVTKEGLADDPSLDLLPPLR